MAFTFIGTSQSQALGDTAVQISLSPSVPLCRVWNEGPDPCRIVYGLGDAAATDTDIVMPAGLMEVHNKNNATRLSAKCKAGQSCTLHVVGGSGD